MPWSIFIYVLALVYMLFLILFVSVKLASVFHLLIQL